MRIRMVRVASGLAAMLACGLVFCGLGTIPANATTVTSWTPPTQAMSTTFQKDGKTYRYLSAAMTFADEEPLEYCGVNNTVAFYRKLSDMNTTDSSSASYYTLNPLFGVFGSSANSNPDPYMWNLFYNTYIDANGMDASLKSAETADSSSSPFSTQSGYGTNAYLKYRPDILYADSDSDLLKLQTAVKTINGFSSDSQYYKAKSDTYVGDENYNPIVAYREGQGMSREINSVHNVAQAVNDALYISKLKGINLAARYDTDVQAIANKYEEFIRGTEYYIQSQIAAGKVKKKTVIYIDSVSEDGTIMAYDVRDPESVNSYADCTSQGSMGVVNNPVLGRAGSGKNQGFFSHALVQIDLKEAASADALIMVEPDNYGDSDGIARSDEDADVQATRLKDLFAANGYTAASQREIYTTDGNLIMGSGYRSLAGCAQIYAWTNAFLYPELLNSVDMTAYFYETFYHLKSSALSNALTLNLGDTLSMPDGQSLADLSSYSASDIDAKFLTGIKYYLAHEKAIVKANPELQASDELKDAYSYLGIKDTSGDSVSGIATGASITTGSGTTNATYKATSSSAVTYVRASVGSGVRATVPASIKINGKTYKVSKIAKGAFKGTVVKTVTIKSTKLVKASVRGSLKSSKIATVKVPKSKFAIYRKYFSKSNSGKKVTVKK